MRGSATDWNSVTIGPLNGTALCVALCVNRLPVSFGVRNHDQNAIGLKRIEVLSGPHGTLFGARSQSVDLRCVTQESRQGAFETGFFRARQY